MVAQRKKNNELLPTDFFHLFVNSPIDATLYRRIIKLIPSPRPDCVVVSLVTLGGSPNDAYRIGRYLQMMFKEVIIFVPSVCASAGTLLVCAASRLLIGAMSELGPLDAQLLKSDELGTRRSGLVTRSLFENLGVHAFDLHTSLVERIIDHSGGTIKYRTAAHVAGEMVVGLMHGLYEQMNPDQIGEDYRFLKIAEEYGRRLAQNFGNISDESLKKLVYDYPSHDFIIDFRESLRLFDNVDLPSGVLSNELADGTKTPLEALAAKERIVFGALVVGCPVYESKSDETEYANVKPVVSNETGASDDSRSSSAGSNGANADARGSVGESVDGSTRKARGRSKEAEKPPSQ